jgi:hypothetical protein
VQVTGPLYLTIADRRGPSATDARGADVVHGVSRRATVSGLTAPTAPPSQPRSRFDATSDLGGVGEFLRTRRPTQRRSRWARLNSEPAINNRSPELIQVPAVRAAVEWLCLGPHHGVRVLVRPLFDLDRGRLWLVEVLACPGGEPVGGCGPLDTTYLGSLAADFERLGEVSRG